jgi:hypothetical protein
MASRNPENFGEYVLPPFRIVCGKLLGRGGYFWGIGRCCRGDTPMLTDRKPLLSVARYLATFSVPDPAEDISIQFGVF